MIAAVGKNAASDGGKHPVSQCRYDPKFSAKGRWSLFCCVLRTVQYSYYPRPAPFALAYRAKHFRVLVRASGVFCGDGGPPGFSCCASRLYRTQNLPSVHMPDKHHVQGLSNDKNSLSHTALATLQPSGHSQSSSFKPMIPFPVPVIEQPSAHPLWVPDCTCSLSFTSASP